MITFIISACLFGSVSGSFMSLAIDGNILPHAAILAPMSGVTDWPFRRAVRRCGGGLVVTEMIASAAVLCRAARLAERLLLIPQLARLEVAFARALRQVLFTREQALAL